MIAKLTDPMFIVPLMTSAAAFFGVLGLLLPLAQRNPYGSRLKAITDRRKELTAAARKRFEKRPTLRQQMSARVNLMKTVLERLNMRDLMEQPTLRKRMLQAGKRSNQAVVTFAFTQLALPVVLAAVSALILFGSPAYQETAAVVRLAIVFGAAVVGYYLPQILLSNAIKKRQEEILLKLPDALDLMVICVESGMSVEAAFQKVSEEMTVDGPALSEEWAITYTELAFLNDRRAALENLAERTGLPTVKSMVTALAQAERYGTPVGVSLRVVAQENRDARMSRAEEKAASLPAKLTVPMVMFFLPVLFMVLIGPTIVGIMRRFGG
ncbi:MAG: type II secretion system F family protein [Rhodospirillales bacterium]|nr:type II secretion system F family protein [Rhodospirillales bacterium]